MKTIILKTLPLTDIRIIKFIKESVINQKVSISLLKSKGYNPQIIPEFTTLFKINEEQNNLESIEYISPNQSPEIDKIYKIDEYNKYISDKIIRNEFFNELPGILIFDNNNIELLPIHNNSIFTLSVTDDKLKVYLNIYPGNTIGTLSTDDIISNVQRNGITARIDTIAIESAIKTMVENNIHIEKILIAEGEKPVEGKDGYINYLVNPEINFSPKMTDDGRIDFYHLHIFNQVEKDQPLLEYHPAIEGKNGIDVFGKIIEARKSKDIPNPQGKNTYYDSKNLYLLRALISGNYSIQKETAVVNDVFQIDGNIDFHTGNIDTKGFIAINGDVKSGFSVKSHDSIDIKGIVEDAYIAADGHISIKSGFSGTGKGIIECKGKVDVKYVHNQKIFSRDTINVSNEVIDSELYALDKILIVGGKYMSAYGGRLIAGHYIEANCFGNKYGTYTLIEAGYDYQYIHMMENNKKYIENSGNELKNIEDSISKLSHMIYLPIDQKKILALMLDQKLTIYKKLTGPEENKEQLVKINTIIDKVMKNSHLPEQQLKNFYEYNEKKCLIYFEAAKKLSENYELENIINTPSNAKIKVLKYIYPGVTIMINKRKFIVNSEMINKTFMLSKDGNEVIFG